MKKFFISKRPRQATEEINEILMKDYKDQIKFHVDTPLGSVKTSFQPHGRSSVLSAFDGHLHIEKITTQLAVDSGRSFGGYIQYKIPHSLSITASTVSRKFPYKLQTYHYIPKCDYSLFGRLKVAPYEGHAGFGIQNGAYHTLASVATKKICLILHNYLTDRENRIKLSMFTKTGLFSSVSCDASIFQFQKIQIGWYQKWKSAASFASFDLFTLKFKTGGYLITPDKKGKAAFIANYNFIENEGTADAGFSYNRLANFKGKISSNGTVRLLTTFKPNDWVDVTFQSTTTAQSKFTNVTYGYSLYFHTEYNPQSDDNEESQKK